MANQKGVGKAKEAADVHESNPNADINKRIFNNISDADEVTDLLNNQIGRDIGTQYTRPQTTKTIAIRMLDEFYQNGVYTINKIIAGENVGKYEVIRIKITKEQYDHMKNEYINNLDDHGLEKYFFKRV